MRATAHESRFLGIVRFGRSSYLRCVWRAFQDYQVVTRWRLAGSVEEVAHIVRDTASLVRWWPAAFLDALVLREGDEHQVGKTVRLRTKGWLPYLLRFDLLVEDSCFPRTCSLRVWGDFEGGCLCTAEAVAGGVELTFDWRVRVRKPLVRRLSWLLKPVFVANHRWVMRRGLESLDLELRRRRFPDCQIVEAPPGPTFPFDRVTQSLRRRWTVATHG